MKIGMIADTHIPVVAKELPGEIAAAFANVDLILHAGDIQVSRTLDDLEQIAPVYAARGNNDYFEDPRMKPVQLLEVGGLKVATVHIFVYPETPLQTYWREWQQKVDVVVIGDTHVPELLESEGVLMVNPGSPTSPGPNMYLGLGHVGILDISEGQAEAKIISLKDGAIITGQLKASRPL